MQSIFAERALLPEGWVEKVLVAIGEDGRIAQVENESAAKPEALHVPILLPALGNLHSHTFQRAMAGLAERRGPSERDSFWTWRAVMYRFLDLLTPDEIEAVAAFAFMEMQEAGFAAVAEFHYLHNQPGGAAYADPGELSARIAVAARETGIGLTLLPVYYRQGGVDGRPLAGGQLRFGNDLDSFATLMERAKGIVHNLPADTGLGIAPHSLRAVPPDDLKALENWLPEQPFHMHIAEQAAEVEEMLAILGARPVEWLLEHLPVDDGWCLIHCTHMEPYETEALARTGAVAGLCPVTEANLGDGIFDATRFAASGGRLGVGSDSNILISVNEELRQLEYSQRLRDRARVVMAESGHSAGRRLYDRALAGSAQALGRHAGAIAPGKWADLVALSPREAFPMSNHPDLPLDGWVFTNDHVVTDLWSGGRHRVREGRHTGRDAIAARYRACLAAIAERM
ncbi:MAG: formimidoylglutamate deiminase [Rhizobiaceae bacterium]